MSAPTAGPPQSRARPPPPAWATALALTRQQPEPALAAAPKTSWKAPCQVQPQLLVPWAQAHWKARTLGLATAPVRQQELAALLFRAPLFAAS